MEHIKPSISIIIPIYNMQKYIKECLDSVINQTLINIEVLCVDDCSTDNSAEIIKEYLSDSRIKYYSLPENSGSGAARNFAIDVAEGEFLIFMDPDDLYASLNCLENLYTNAKKHNVLACGGNLLAFKNDDINELLPEIWAETRFEYSGMHSYNDYHYPAGYMRFIFQTAFIKKNMIKFPDYRRRQDPVFFVRAMSLMKNFYAIDQTIYLYRSNYKEIKWNEKNLLGVLSSFEDSFKYYLEYKLWNHFGRDYLDLKDYFNIIIEMKSVKLSTKLDKVLRSIPFNAG